MESSSKVYLYVYDLTNGMARSLAPMIIGRSLEGIWHTAIVAFGNEYFFGDGVCNMPPGTTPFGTPYKKELLGETEIDKELFHEFLSDIKDRFSPVTYNVKTHNCNHFTNECANFLVGTDIPHDILNQATDLFNTSLGKMIEPMVMQQQDALKKGSNNMFGPSASSVGQSMGGLSLGGSGGSKTDKNLIEAKSLTEIQDLLQTYPGLVIDCWSPTCPPCMKFKPIFHEMAEQYGSDKVKFVTVNTKEAPEVAMNFMVTSIPAFFIYQNGECISQFVGTNKAKLDGIVKKLKANLGDDGKSTASKAAEEPIVIRLKYDLGFIQFKPLSNQVILFENISNMNKIGTKIKEIISGVDNDDIQELKELMDDFKISGFTPEILSQLFTLAQKCSEDDLFAVFDFLRCCFITEKLAVSATGFNWEQLDKSISRVEALSEGDPSSVSKNVVNAQMTSTQALCNLFKFKNSSSVLIEEPAKAVRLLSFAGKMLSSQKDKAISGAASIALNIMIKFDEIEVSKIEADSSKSFEDKLKELEERFEIIDEGAKLYCEEATKAYPKIDNSDALFRVIMSECRILHSNFKLVEQFAGDDSFLKNRMRITQKYPSGQLNDGVCDIQKIMTSYIKR